MNMIDFKLRRLIVTYKYEVYDHTRWKLGLNMINVNQGYLEVQ